MSIYKVRDLLSLFETRLLLLLDDGLDWVLRQRWIIKWTFHGQQTRENKGPCWLSSCVLNILMLSEEDAVVPPPLCLPTAVKPGNAGGVAKGGAGGGYYSACAKWGITGLILFEPDYLSQPCGPISCLKWEMGKGERCRLQMEERLRISIYILFSNNKPCLVKVFNGRSSVGGGFA